MQANYVHFQSPQFRVLSDSQIKDIHFASLHILEKTGVAIHAAEVLDLLAQAGADVSNPRRVTIPSPLVEQALRDAPKNVTLYTRDGRPMLHLNGTRTYFGAVMDQPDILDPRTGIRRPHIVADTADLVRLADALPHMDWLMTSQMVHGLPPELAELVILLQCLLYSAKPVAASTLNAGSLRRILEMCEIVSGGSDNLRKRPFFLNSVEPTSPLVHGREALEMSLVCAEAGVPNIVFGMLMGGATAPATPAAILAVANAELLSHLTVIQLKKPGAPVIYGAEPNIMDMRTSIFPYGAPELCLLDAALTEITHAYGLPMFGTAGTTDAKVLGAQAAVEITQQIITSALSGADMVHDIGLMDHCSMISPELIVLCDEIIGMTGILMGGVEINEETLALDLIDRVGPGGNFLAEAHTLKWFRKHWFPSIMDRKQKTIEDYGQPIKHCEELLREKTIKILDEHVPAPLPDDVAAELQKLEKTWFDQAGVPYGYPTLD
ncbi:MAG: trimethylamine methyltransferase family protein [Thermodesulfobacteriota bacterium]